MTSETNHLWGGRFNEPTDEFVKIFGASVSLIKYLHSMILKDQLLMQQCLMRLEVLTDFELKRDFKRS